MSTLSDFYTQQARQTKSSIAWIEEAKSKALTAFEAFGFPDRHHEEWKYTALDVFAAKNFTHGTAVCEATGNEGIVMMPLAQALIEYEALVKQHLNHIMHLEHAFHALNTAMLQDGVFVYVPEQVKAIQPILLEYKQPKDGEAVYLRHLIVAEPGSEVVVVEVYQGTDAPYVTNTITEIHAAKHAKITHYKLQLESKQACHFGHVFVRQMEQSHFQSHSLSLGGTLVRSDLTIDLKEEHAQCLLNGIYAPNEGQHVDHHTIVNHLVPHGTSRQDYKGILQGKSRAVFNGKVLVARDAQKSSASQSNKNLLLSAQAEIDTKPQLEIDADDVVCSHGATVGQLDEEALFYLATRGINRQEAALYLIQAFAAENLALIPDEQMARRCADLLNKQTGAL